MDHDTGDWKPSNMKLESEISPDDCASHLETSQLLPGTSSIEPNTVSPEIIVFNLPLGLPSKTEPGSNIDQEVMDVALKIKEEIIEEETASTDPLMKDDLVENSPKMVPSMAHGVGCVIQESMVIKSEANCFEENVTNIDGPKIDIIGAEEEMRGEDATNRNASSLNLNPVVLLERINLNLVNGSEVRIKHENEIVRDLVRCIKVENIKDEFPSTDPAPCFKSNARRYDKTRNPSPLEECSSSSELSLNLKTGRMVEHQGTSVHLNCQLKRSRQDYMEATSNEKQVSTKRRKVQLSSNMPQKEGVMVSADQVDKNSKNSIVPLQLLPSTSFSKERSTEHDEKNFSCMQCTAEFNTKLKLQTHSRTHSDTRLFQCDICFARFKSKLKLKKHLITHSNVRAVSCKQHSAQFKQKLQLQTHLLRHSNERAFFTCEQCSATFKSKNGLKKHLLVHSNEKTFACDQCSAQFKRKSDLKHHLLIPSNHRTFSCELCSAKFKQKQSLRNHLVIHSNEKAFSCEHCSDQFKRKSDLKRHLLIHSIKRAFFTCEQCSATFKSKDSLNQHLLVHSNKKAFACDQCSAHFF